MAGGFRVVDVFAFRAVELDSAHIWEVMLAHGQEGMSVAKHTGTFAKVAFLILVKLAGC